MRLRGRPQAAEGPQGRVGRENFGPDGNGGGGAHRAEGRSPSQAAAGRRSRPEGGSLRAGACGLQGVAEEAEAGRRQGRPVGRPRRSRGSLRPMGRLMLKCAEGQGIVTGK